MTAASLYFIHRKWNALTTLCVFDLPIICRTSLNYLHEIDDNYTILSITAIERILHLTLLAECLKNNTQCSFKTFAILSFNFNDINISVAYLVNNVPQRSTGNFLHQNTHIILFVIYVFNLKDKSVLKYNTIHINKTILLCLQLCELQFLLIKIKYI